MIQSKSTQTTDEQRRQHHRISEIVKADEERNLAHMDFYQPINRSSNMIRRKFKSFHENVTKPFVHDLMQCSCLTKSKEALLTQVMQHYCMPSVVYMDLRSYESRVRRCKGCTRVLTNRASAMSGRLMNRVVKEAQPLGIDTFFIHGADGRRDDILELALKYQDCRFLALTTETVDEAFARALAIAGNVALVVSGVGSDYLHSQNGGSVHFPPNTFEVLRRHGVPFGFAVCYHGENVDRIVSDEFLDTMVDKGCLFGWYSPYWPVHSGLLDRTRLTNGQMDYLFRRIQTHRRRRSICLVDLSRDVLLTGFGNSVGFLTLDYPIIHYTNGVLEDITLLESLELISIRHSEESSPSEYLGTCLFPG